MPVEIDKDSSCEANNLNFEFILVISIDISTLYRILCIFHTQLGFKTLINTDIKFIYEI